MWFLHPFYYESIGGHCLLLLFFGLFLSLCWLSFLLFVVINCPLNSFSEQTNQIKEEKNKWKNKCTSPWHPICQFQRTLLLWLFFGERESIWGDGASSLETALQVSPHELSPSVHLSLWSSCILCTSLCWKVNAPRCKEHPLLLLLVMVVLSQLILLISLQALAFLFLLLRLFLFVEELSFFCLLHVKQKRII